MKNYELATVAFSRVVSFDPEYGDAWNNLAAAHLFMKNKKQAFSALEQAVKFKYESWKLWENYMITALVRNIRISCICVLLCTYYSVFFVVSFLSVSVGYS